MATLHSSTRDASHWGQRFSIAVGARIADFTERQIGTALHKRDWGFSPEDTARLMGF